MPDFDGPAILRSLTEHDVAFILIGGFAAVVHGSPLLTRAGDVVPPSGSENEFTHTSFSIGTISR